MKRICAIAIAIVSAMAISASSLDIKDILNGVKKAVTAAQQLKNWPDWPDRYCQVTKLTSTHFTDHGLTRLPLSHSKVTTY